MKTFLIIISLLVVLSCQNAENNSSNNHIDTAYIPDSVDSLDFESPPANPVLKDDNAMDSVVKTKKDQTRINK